MLKSLYNMTNLKINKSIILYIILFYFSLTAFSSISTPTYFSFFIPLLYAQKTDTLSTEYLIEAGDVYAQNSSPSMGEDKGEGADNPYLIEAGDVLEIVVLGEEELTRTLMVMHNGSVSFPMIGDVKIAGLTTDSAGYMIAEKLKKYFTHPVVSIILKSPTTPHVSVFGEVLRPGAVEYQRGLRVTDYLALAGGGTQLANLRRVKVVRFTGDKPIVTVVSVDAILNRGLADKNFELKSGDWIYVPRRFSVNWTTILQLATLAVTVVNLIIIVNQQ